MKKIRPVDSDIDSVNKIITSIKIWRKHSSYFSMRNLHCTKTKQAGLSYISRGPFFSIILLLLQFFLNFLWEGGKPHIAKNLQMKRFQGDKV